MPNSTAQTCLTALAIGLIVLMGSIVLQVVCSALDINPLATFADALPVVGEALTLNSLLDFQWHLLVLLALLPAGIVWSMDRHIRVDFYYQRQTTAWRARLDLIGNVLFAAPFLGLVLPASLDFANRAWQSDEGSRNGGLVDLWLIKFSLPLGFMLLALAIGIESVRLLRAAR
jgi:TRAP-type mannitol/chloroaromatic compound transport system permease small subunit